MALILFLVKVFVISLSGVLQPGPVTATAISMGARNKWAGALLAIGHGIIEFPLMILIILGLGSIFQKTATQVTIGIAGGSVLLYMAFSMFKSSSAQCSTQPERVVQPINATSNRQLKTQHSKLNIQNSAVLAGIVLTASNPYFLIWWATVGLALATDATRFGLYAFALFAVVHWLVDLIWVTALSLAGFHGTTLLGPKSLTIILRICAAAMLFFGLFFLIKATESALSG
jgi:threonine/homoserine/homoserine lactone efflux protein